MNESIAELWHRIKQGLSRFKNLDLQERLNPPATNSAIDDFQSKFNIKLPSDIVESLLVHDGECVQTTSIFQLQFCSLELMSHLISDLRKEPGVALRSDSLYTPSIPPKHVRRDIDWSSNWLPVMYEQASGLMCDLDPAELGVTGQIVEMHWLPDGFARSVAFPDYKSLLTFVAEIANDPNTKQGEYEVIYLPTE